MASDRVFYVVARVPNGTQREGFGYLAYEVQRHDAAWLSKMDRKICHLQAALRSGTGESARKTLDGLYAKYNEVEKRGVHIVSDRLAGAGKILEIYEAHVFV